jgi:hypothetical protein
VSSGTLLTTGIVRTAARLLLESPWGTARHASRFAATEVADQRLSAARIAGDGIKWAGAETNAARCAASLIKEDRAEFWVAVERTLGTGSDTGSFCAEPADERLVKAFGLLFVDPDPRGRGPQGIFPVENTGNFTGPATRAYGRIDTKRFQQHKQLY